MNTQTELDYKKQKAPENASDPAEDGSVKKSNLPGDNSFGGMLT